ncbi:stress induced protein [Tasmannia lanceolata]|uniref:stress induced protein n=1 Tax=Tasmannia lanceolata TaxID=3420 RepID=UPI004062F46F
MATVQEKPTFINKNNPSEEQFQEDYEENPTATGCFCFRLFCFQRNSDNGDHRFLIHEESRETWWMKKIRSVKQVSEIVAGPKWKNFIRKFKNQKKNRKSDFHYDSYSYALNFDGGANQEGNELYNDFSDSAPFVLNRS